MNSMNSQVEIYIRLQKYGIIKLEFIQQKLSSFIKDPNIVSGNLLWWYLEKMVNLIHKIRFLKTGSILLFFRLSYVSGSGFLYYCEWTYHIFYDANIKNMDIAPKIKSSNDYCNVHFQQIFKWYCIQIFCCAVYLKMRFTQPIISCYKRTT